jgi:hypothetical protein
MIKPLLAAAVLAAVSAPALAQLTYGDVQLSVDRGKATIGRSKTGAAGATFDLTGQVVTLSAPGRNIVARRMVGSLDKKGKGGEYRLVTTTATGTVRITLKDEANGHQDVITCEKAVYTAGATAGTAKIVVSGDVRWIATDKALVKPSDVRGRDGVITITPDEDRIEINDLSATVTPIEPAPKGKEKP